MKEILSKMQPLPRVIQSNNISVMGKFTYPKHLQRSSYKRCLVLLMALFVSVSHAVNAQSTLKKLKDDELDQSVKQMLNRFEKKIYFTQNDGQWPENVLYKADFKYGQAIATRQGMLVGTFDPASIDAIRQAGDDEEEAIKNGTPLDGSGHRKSAVRGHGWLMNFLNASPNMKIENRDAHLEKFNYFIGNDKSKFIGNTKNYQEIWYKNVYDNVDVRYYPSEEGTLEYDIVCKPGFDKNKISIQFDGIEKMTTNEKGILVLKTSVGDVTFPAPIVYQSLNGKRTKVEANYIVTKNNVLGFNLGKYDASQPLIIDPIALRWATWITNNSDGDDHGHGVWVDQSDGAIYILARIIGSGLITVNAFQNASAGSLDMVLGKYLEPTTVGGSGTRVWQTYLGGSGDDNPYAMEQGPDGNIYVTGYTSSSNFPLLGGPAFTGTSLDARSQSSNNIFITKINKAGNSIKSAVIGGNGTEQSFDLRFDPSGDIVIGGYTQSTNLASMYSGSGATNTNKGGNDVLIFKINSDLNTIRWMKNYGGSSGDQINIMNVNASTGDIYIGGTTSSSDF
ncbi:MAG TPA: SBBP repeat-containing protein, partial [Chitinophagales bacterium]|nr:SBBP repeat-containing protein [Chitinophagales bacterium]